ncbi:MAG: hypothetical protein AB8E15_07635 [Bdellovibrionales bacterium]
MQLPFNLNTKIDENLNDIPLERDQFLLAKEMLQDQIKYSENMELEKKRELYSLLGYVCRVLELPKESLQYARKAVELSREINIILYVVIDQIRLASSVGLHDFEASEELFKECISICESYQPLDEVVDFAYFNYGKILFQKENVELGKHYFTKALEIREKKQSPDLVSAAMFAIKACDKKSDLH